MQPLTSGKPDFSVPNGTTNFVVAYVCTAPSSLTFERIYAGISGKSGLYSAGVHQLGELEYRVLRDLGSCFRELPERSHNDSSSESLWVKWFRRRFDIGNQRELGCAESPEQRRTNEAYFFKCHHYHC